MRVCLARVGHLAAGHWTEDKDASANELGLVTPLRCLLICNAL